LDIFKILIVFGIFLKFLGVFLEIFESIFCHEFFGSHFFWEDFFGMSFLRGIFWEKFFWEDFLGGIFLGGIFGRNSLFTLLRSAKLFEYGI
jgi:hypothetical protein